MCRSSRKARVVRNSACELRTGMPDVPLPAQTRHDPVFDGSIECNERRSSASVSSASATWARRWRPISSAAAHEVDGLRHRRRSARSVREEHAARATASRRRSSPRKPSIVITMLPTGREVREVLVEARGGALGANLRSRHDRHRHEFGRPGRARARSAASSPRAGSRWSMRRSPAACRAPQDGTLAIMIGGDAGGRRRGQAGAGRDGRATCSRSAGSAAATP